MHKERTGLGRGARHEGAVVACMGGGYACLPLPGKTITQRAVLLTFSMAVCCS